MADISFEPLPLAVDAGFIAARELYHVQSRYVYAENEADLSGLFSSDVRVRLQELLQTIGPAQSARRPLEKLIGKVEGFEAVLKARWFSEEHQALLEADYSIPGMDWIVFQDPTTPWYWKECIDIWNSVKAFERRSGRSVRLCFRLGRQVADVHALGDYETGGYGVDASRPTISLSRTLLDLRSYLRKEMCKEVEGVVVQLRKVNLSWNVAASHADAIRAAIHHHFLVAPRSRRSRLPHDIEERIARAIRDLPPDPVTLRAVARRVHCSNGVVGKSIAWKTWMQSHPKKKAAMPSRRAIGSDELLNNLIEEQTADDEGSPLDALGRQLRVAKRF